MGEKYKPVVFENSLGEEISNDPIWHAQKTLRDAGINIDEPEEATAAPKSKTKAKTAPKAPAVETPAVIESTDDEDELDDDETDEDADDDEPEEIEQPRDYLDIDAPDLKAYAKSRGVDVTGLKKAGEVRAALIADDAAKSDSE